MTALNWKRSVLVASLGVGMTWFSGGFQRTQAQDDARPPEASREAQQAGETRVGRVEKLLYNGRDDIDGLRLEGGIEVHFPPHMGDAIARLVKPGDKVEVQGATETRPRGEVVFEASRIVSRGETIQIERPRPPHRPKDHREQEVPMKATATVKEFATNRHGDVDGLLLSDGTEVKLPPHQGQDLKQLIRQGEEVRVEGRRHETPHGDIHLHADRITAVASGRSIERDGPRGRPVPPHERGREGRDEGPAARRAPAPTAEQFDEILRELREMRRLLEAQQKNS